MSEIFCVTHGRMLNECATVEECSEIEFRHKSQEDLMQEHDVCEKVRTCVRGYKHDGYHVNKHGFVLGATIG